MSVGVREGRLSCPDGKRTLLRAAIAEARDEAQKRGRVRWKRARSLVGKLSNIAQVLPELKRVLRGGYAVTQAPAAGSARGGWRRAGEWRQLRRGGRAEEDWVELLDVAEQLLEENEG
eukprot:4779745-Pleurochrysis_carterae.AAC.1